MILRVKRSTYRSLIKLLDPANPRKIAAIKAVRSETKCGLKEAKDAVELLMYEEGLSPHPIITQHRIHTGPSIRKMVVDYGSGDIEIDIEAMELKALMEMQTIGLDACSDILELVETLKAYESGKRIGVINEEMYLPRET